MFGLENRKTRTRRTHHTNNPLTTTSSARNRKWYQRKNPNRRAGGLKAALHNPNTTSHGRKNAKHELRAMGRGNEAHVPFSVRVRHWFGMHGNSRRRSRL
ncbi:hypothetical protein SISNIDRAFT_481609 [Sistotremastrum niveocremeum HHB9708]|uniref:Uncharacterized protein n=1 Tax=Sistotremastrum niveocremeum HHB9708 TaxID=1314777 RepID=A0A164ZGV6_9AGAM|nr:hypothetical protein SISNIDRAFT_481609 [Sistotremastrum niveocremeum HHB9708]